MPCYSNGYHKSNFICFLQCTKQASNSLRPVFFCPLGVPKTESPLQELCDCACGSLARLITFGQWRTFPERRDRPRGMVAGTSTYWAIQNDALLVTRTSESRTPSCAHARTKTNLEACYGSRPTMEPKCVPSARHQAQSLAYDSPRSDRRRLWHLRLLHKAIRQWKRDDLS